MSAIRGKDTGPEMQLRRIIHAMGYRYRLHAKGVPGRPDVCIKSRKKAIFVHGCFWHAHENCPLANTPKTRTGYWGPKLAANKQRDARKQAELEKYGWSVLTIWECELREPKAIPRRIAQFLGPARASSMKSRVKRKRIGRHAKRESG